MKVGLDFQLKILAKELNVRSLVIGLEEVLY
jgi:hypothetical protein